MQITFPHSFDGNALDDRKYTFDDVDGGIKRIADFGIARNSFFGGTVTVLGLISKLGFYACQHYETRKIVGFLVDKPERVTELGRELLRKRFSDCEVIFDVATEPSTKRDELLNEFKKHGVAPEIITQTNALELKGLIENVQAGNIENKKVTVEPQAVDVQDTVVKPKQKRTMSI